MLDTDNFGLAILRESRLFLALILIKYFPPNHPLPPPPPPGLKAGRVSVDVPKNTHEEEASTDITPPQFSPLRYLISNLVPFFLNCCLFVCVEVRLWRICLVTWLLACKVGSLLALQFWCRVELYCKSWHVLCTTIGGQCFQFCVTYSYIRTIHGFAVIMYVLLPMPMMFFAGSDASSLFTESSANSWLDATKFLTGASTVGSIAIPAILKHAGIIGWGALVMELSSFFVLVLAFLCFIKMNDQDEYMML